MQQLYPSKIDKWLGAILLLVPVVSIYAVMNSWRTDAGDPFSVLLTLAFGIGLPLWILLSTRYVLGTEKLHIRCGPFTKQIAIADIHDVQPTRNPLSSPALSLDRLRLRYGNNKSVMISPRLQGDFLRELNARRNGQE